MLSIKGVRTAIVVYQTVIGIFAIGVLCENCDSGWVLHNNRCYYFSRDTKNQTESITACEDMEGVLASAATREENDFLWNKKPMSPGEQFYWIGLVADTSDWYWNDGSKADNVMIDNNHTDSVCVQVSSDSEFSSISCTASRHYICESSYSRTNWNKYNDMWYYVSKTSKTHQNNEVTNMIAIETCWNMTYDARTTLAVMNDVTGLSLVDGNYWIALSKLHWLDGSQYYWHNWWHNEDGPVGRQPCVLMHPTQNKWEGNMDRCSQQHRYICQRDIPTSSTTLKTTTTTQPTTTKSPTTTTVLTLEQSTTNPDQTPTTQMTGDNTSVTQEVVDITEALTASANSSEPSSAPVISLDKTKLYIIIGVVGGIVVLAVLMACICCLIPSRRRKQKTEQGHTDRRKSTVDNEYDYASVSPNARIHTSADEPYSYVTADKGDVELSKKQTQKGDDAMTAVPIYSEVGDGAKVHADDDDDIPVAYATSGSVNGIVENSIGKPDDTSAENSAMPVYSIPDKSRPSSNKKAGLAQTDNHIADTNNTEVGNSAMPIYAVPDKTKSNSLPVQQHSSDVYATVDKSKKSSSKSLENGSTTPKEQENAKADTSSNKPTIPTKPGSKSEPSREKTEVDSDKDAVEYANT